LSFAIGSHACSIRGLPPIILVAANVRKEMRDLEQFDQFIRSGLAQYGLEASEEELQVMRVAEQVYGPHRDALLAADLSDVPLELDLDPSRAPARIAGEVGHA
jgi:hypothetical protein